MRSVCSIIIKILIFILMITTSLGFEDLLWPDRRFSEIKGDLYLAGFFPVHRFDKNRICGEIDEEGLQQLESFMFTANKINNDKTFLPGIKLGAMAFDTCYSAPHTLKVSLDHLGKFLASNPYFRKILSCTSGPLMHRSYYQILGVIGGRSSDVSLQLANYLRIFSTLQVSYKSTVFSLSNKKKYRNFLRTVPSSISEVQAFIEIMKTFKWTYISVVYSDSAYGNSGFLLLQKLAHEENICFATAQGVITESFTDEDYDKVIDGLVKASARAVVVFGEPAMVRKIMAASSRKGQLNRFIWLGSEAWSRRDYVVEGFESAAEGALCVADMYKPPEGFIEHFKSLTPFTNGSNPWLYELWEKKMNCRLQAFAATPYNENYSSCSNKSLEKELYMETAPSAQLVSNAVYSVAHAVKDMQKRLCGSESGLCRNMSESLLTNASELLDYMFRVKFRDDTGNLFQFDKNGDALPRYSIVNYQRQGTSRKYIWKQVGTFIGYSDSAAKLTLDPSIIQFKHNKRHFPESVCSAECSPEQTKVILDNKCCWFCRDCKDIEYVNATKCTACDKGFKPNRNKTFCEKIPVVYMNYGHPWAIFCLSFSAFGILVTIAVGVIFWIYWDTPIVKASARELSAVLLTGIFLSFLLTFPIVAPPSKSNCGIIRFFMGVTYTACYAAIVIKTRRIARIFELKGRLQNRKFTSAQSQIMLAAAVISIEVVINATWLMYDKPSVEHYYPTWEEDILICSTSNCTAFLFGLLYPFLLMIMCTVYAFKTRKCPAGFNEARYICFTNYTTCVIWLAFLPTFILDRDNDVRTAMLSLLLSLSGMVQIACLFLPKIHIAMFQPENNTKGVVMGYTESTGSSAL